MYSQKNYVNYLIRLSLLSITNCRLFEISEQSQLRTSGIIKLIVRVIISRLLSKFSVYHYKKFSCVRSGWLTHSIELLFPIKRKNWDSNNEYVIRHVEIKSLISANDVTILAKNMSSAFGHNFLHQRFVKNI